MSALKKLVHELRESVMWIDAPVESGALVSIAELFDLTAAMENDPELKELSSEELKAFEGFRITLYHAMKMTPEVAAAHVLAHWTQAKQAVMTLSIGSHAETLVAEIGYGCGCGC